MSITKTIATNFRQVWVNINEWSKGLPIDRRIQAFSVVAFSVAAPLIYYRKDIQVRLFDGTSAIRAFLKNEKDLPQEVKKISTENYLQRIKDSIPAKDDDKNFDYNSWDDPKKASELLLNGKLSNSQLVESAARVLPSAEPNPTAIKTFEDKVYSFLGNMSTEFSFLVNDNLTFNSVVKGIGEYPKAYAGILLNCITMIAYDHLVSPFLEDAFKNEGLQLRTFTKFSIATASFFLFYRLMNQELPRGLKDISKGLNEKKIAYLGLYNYLSWKTSYKSTCEHILSFLFSKNVKNTQAIILYTQDHNSEGAPVDLIPRTLAEIANTARSEITQEKFKVFKADLGTFLNNAAGDPLSFRRQLLASAHIANRHNAILNFTHVDSLFYPWEISTEENSPMLFNPENSLKYCRGYLFDLVADGNARFTLTATEKEKDLLLSFANRGTFHKIPVYRMKPEDTRMLLRKLYASCDRWDTPKLTEKAIDILLYTIKHHGLKHDLPNKLIHIVDQAIRIAFSEQELKKHEFPEEKEKWEKIGQTVGYRLDQARGLKEQAFERLCHLRKKYPKNDPKIVQAAKDLLFLEHILIRSIYAEIEKLLKEIKNIPCIIDENILIPLMQREHKRLLYTALEKEQAEWFKLPNELNKKFPKRENAISEICNVLTRRRISYQKRNDPATILLFGPPGCGKSYLATYLAKRAYEIYDVEEDPNPIKEENVLRIHLPHVLWDRELDNFLESIYQQLQDCSVSFIILEEIDKIPKEALEKLLQLLEDNTMKSKNGNFVRKGDVTIIFTSNACMDELSKPIDGNLEEQFKLDQEMLKVKWKENAEKSPLPLLDRFQAIVPFRALKEKSKEEYVTIFLEKQKKVYLHHNIEIKFNPSVAEFFAKHIQDNSLRQIKEAIDKMICDVIDVKDIKKFKNSQVIIKVQENRLIAEKTGDLILQ